MNSGFSIYTFPDLFKNYWRFLSLIILCLFSSCGYKVNSVGSNLLSSTESVISGVISPLVGSIAEDKTQRSLLINNAYSAACADPVYAKLFRLESDGSVNDNSPLDSQLVSADAKYSFDLKALSVTSASQNIEYLVKVEGCNGDVYKRPVTAFDKDQNLDARTTVIAEVINSNTLLSTTLNQVDKKEILNLIESVSGTTLSSALASLTNTGAASSQFRKLFGVNPSVILSAKPEVQLISPNTIINELALSVFSASTFHVDPNYSFAYSWKLDGVVKSTSSTWNYIPSANNSGDHQVDLYVGIDDGTGHIDTAKPYYTKNISIHVNNNILPIAPSITLNSSNPSPVNTNTIAVDLNTGVALTHCSNFSHMAFTDTPTLPGIMQFNIDCSTSGTQTENITFSTGDGSKTIYLWAMDNEGTISAAKTLSLVLDTLPPSASFSFSSTFLKGGAIKSISFNAQDLGSGLQSLDLYYSINNGSSYSLLSQLGLTDSSYSWSVPASDISQAKLKLIAVDLTGQSTTVHSNLFEIDSTAPTAPSISRSSAATSISRVVAMNITCSADYDKILFSETSTTPTIADSAWESCASTKNFTVTTGDALKTIYAFAKDAAGNISVSSNVTMTLDTTSPNAPVANLTSAALSSSTSLTFTVPDCTDRASVLVSESATTPLASDSSWQTCVTTASAITYTLIGPVSQGSHTLYVYAKDAVGNVSAASTASMIYDTTNPTLSLTTSLGLLYKGGDTVALSFSASDINGLSTLKIYYTTDGTTYSPVETLATNATTYTWTVPASNTATAKLKFETIDNATTANSTIVYSDVFTVDSTAPSAPTLTRTSNQFSNSTNVTMTVGSCTDIAYILISETNSQPSVGDSNWQLCSTTASAFSKTVSGEGAHTLYAWAKDAAGNRASSANSISMTLDTTAPVIAVTTPSSMQGSVSTGSVTWTLTETNVAASTNFTVEVYNGSAWVSVGTMAATAGANTNTAYTLSSFAVPNVDVTTAKVRVTLVDAGGNSATSESGVFTIESTLPSVSAFSITDGATTPLQNIRVNLTASSTISKITHFCITTNSSTRPTSGDACWRAIDATPPGVTQSTSITISNFYFQLGFTSGNYTLYGFVKNQMGLISSLSNSGAGTASQDKYSTFFTSPQPPVVSNVIASNIDAPSNPIVASEYSVAAGANVFIKWKATDAIGFGGTPMTIEYTTNGSTYTQIATNLLNGSNGSCTEDSSSTTLDDGNTGCYVWSGTSLGTYFLIRVRATNLGSVSSSAQSAPMNSGNISVIAGNVDVGINGSAKSAIISILDAGAIPRVQQFVVMPDGTIILIDQTNGIMIIDPADGKYKVLIPNGATSSNQGDGGDVALAKVKTPQKIILGFDNNLYLWDEVRIRKIITSTTPWTINTIIGGGATYSSASIAGTSLVVSSISNTTNPPFTARPDGTIWFIPNNHTSYLNNATPPTPYSYSISTGVATRVGTFSGVGSNFSSTHDLIATNTSLYSCQLAASFDPITSVTKSILGAAGYGSAGHATRFNPTTLVASQSDSNAYPYNTIMTSNSSLVVGMDGKIYTLLSGYLRRWNDSTSTSTIVMGNGVGVCDDGTAALSCKNSLSDVFIDTAGKLYWHDQGLIRTLDTNGNVLTLAGQNKYYGDGLAAINSRFGTIANIGVKSNGNVVALDKTSLRIRELDRTTGQLNLLAGNNINATPNTTSAANTQSIPFDVWVDTALIGILPATDEVVYNRGNAIAKISSSTGKWVDIAGNGATSYMTADGLGLGSVLLKVAYYPKVVGTSGTSVLAAVASFSSTYNDSTLKTYALSTGVQSSFAGLGGTGNAAWPANGSTLATSLVPHSFSIGAMSYDSTNANWIAYTGGNSIKTLTQGGTIENLFTDSGTTAIRAVTSSRASGHLIVYYCALVSSNYQLKKWDQSTTTITTLAWPSTSIACLANGLSYNSSSNKLVFSFSTNGLQGIAEYTNP